MKTLKQFDARPESIPASTAWYLADLGESLGKQQLFTKQFPQRLKVLREHALIESSVSSNRIEGIEVDQKRIGTITELVKTAIQQSQGPFQIINLQQMCPGVGIDLIRRVLKQLRISRQVECLGRGQHAKWQKTKDYQLGNTHSNG